MEDGVEINGETIFPGYIYIREDDKDAPNPDR